MPQFNNEALLEVCITAGRQCSQYGFRAKGRKCKTESYWKHHILLFVILTSLTIWYPCEKELILQKQKNKKTYIFISSLFQKQLNENETYAQLSNLERKLAQLEQNNFAIQEFIASKKSETNYEPQKEKVYKLSQDYNNAIKDNIRKGGVV